jgi:transaldolase
VQRPLWASTSTKNPAYPDTLYVDGLIGADTITTLPEATIAAFEDHGTLAATITQGVQDAQTTVERLAQLGVDLPEVARVLEAEGVAAFAKSYDGLLSLLQSTAAQANAS